MAPSLKSSLSAERFSAAARAAGKFRQKAPPARPPPAADCSPVSGPAAIPASRSPSAKQCPQFSLRLQLLLLPFLALRFRRPVPGQPSGVLLPHRLQTNVGTEAPS